MLFNKVSFMLRQESYLFVRNKVTKIYSIGSFIALILSVFLLFILRKAQIPMSVNQDILALFIVGGHIYIYGVYSFSWENSFKKIALNNADYFLLIIWVKVILNFFISSMILVVVGAVFHYKLGEGVKLLIIAWGYSVSIGIWLTLFLTSFQQRFIDLYDDRFVFIRQPPVHILVIATNFLIYIIICKLCRYYSYETNYILIIYSICFIILIVLFPFIIKRITKNLKVFVDA
ncbi:hypothetical protein [Echinicola salinicaeni]|uniref:hypothetical protein n=1 Tax=Echinicola salinicaeni TaxID=2762757 RepID=UPI001645D271|nr:hypothetical protein [Echinicola salinicaeni]